MDYQTMKENMINRQLIRRGISDTAVIEALRKVERHLFVPAEYTENAYDDAPLPIGDRQTISQPYIVAYMTEALRLKNDSIVLEIGTGCGYQTAVLAEIAKRVYTIERIKSLADKAKMRLDSMGYKNIEYKIGNGYDGWRGITNFDAILVSCAPIVIPQNLAGKLKNHGRMIIPVGKQGAQTLKLIEKTDRGMTTKDLMLVRFVPMINGID